MKIIKEIVASMKCTPNDWYLEKTVCWECIRNDNLKVKIDKLGNYNPWLTFGINTSVIALYVDDQRLNELGRQTRKLENAYKKWRATVNLANLKVVECSD